ncbi:hypothetical protein DR61_1300 [Burkholderia pseudomallei]|uniref:hypothetical protein n=1 Tax=Burkholderia pseudomallei TaxID=28450 RepID=UPI00050E14B1|nr:hypothetical protein [Burkholderia pseudomallei]AIS48744.1 hypothetical protein DR61_1300 [Burkholderia pseudomallei]KGD20237.1 hypothetical protein DR60_4365 [Burkholderia pseudomallei]CAJ4994075.1 Uncharacterised protein [Burkholderia pseudomallei]CAJ5325815.1 Uncharacterised protein [Burkholderia pseudomallei]CAJ9467273.1 Uncharacterised protein [Burkholderia pseudomallei]
MEKSKAAHSTARIRKIINGHAVTVIRGPAPEGLARVQMIRSEAHQRVAQFLKAATATGAKPEYRRRQRRWYVGQFSLERWAYLNDVPGASNSLIHSLYHSPAGSGHAI